MDHKVRIGIAGAGTMSSSMALIFVKNGFDTVVHVRSLASAERAENSIRTAMDSDIKAGKLTEQGAEELLARIKFSMDPSCFKDRDLIVESIAENLEIKQNYWEQISRIAPEDCVLATNTSGLSINSIAERVSGKHRFLGMHWFNPPHLVPLIEIIRGDETDDRSTALVRDIALALHKKPVLCKKDAPGFIANRIQYAVLRECMEIVERGIADPEAVDDAMKYGLGFRYAALGPFEVADLGGLDIFYHISEYLNGDLSNASEPQKMIRDCYERGDYGVKTGKGIYDYGGGRDKEVIQKRDALFNRIYEALYSEDAE